MNPARLSLKFTKTLGLCALLAGLPAAFATPVFDFAAGGTTSWWNGSVYSLGYTFNVSAPFSFNALGVYDLGSNGLGGAHDIAVWNSSGGLVASATVSGAGTSSEVAAAGNGSWVYQSLGSTVSLANGNYTIAAYFGSNSVDAVQYSGTTSGLIQNVIGVSYTGYAFSNGGESGLVLPTNTGFQIGDPFYFGPNMATVPTSSVPDSGTTAGLLGFAFLSLVALRRRFDRA